MGELYTAYPVPWFGTRLCFDAMRRFKDLGRLRENSGGIGVRWADKGGAGAQETGENNGGSGVRRAGESIADQETKVTVDNSRTGDYTRNYFWCPVV